MAGYAVEPSALAAGDARLAEVSGACRAALQPLAAEAVQLFGGRWQGAAAAAFRLGWEDWLAGVRTMLDGLDAMAAAVGASGAAYAATDDRVRGSMAVPE